eukprot:3529634-Amphidinium_carterae.1
MDQNPRAHRMFTTRQGNAPLCRLCNHTLALSSLLKVSVLEPLRRQVGDACERSSAAQHKLNNLVGKHNA